MDDNSGPMTQEVALELLRVKCLGMAAKGAPLPPK